MNIEGPLGIDEHNYFVYIPRNDGFGSSIMDRANSKNHWHRVTLKNAAHHNKDIILDKIVREYQFLPVKYQTQGADAVFIFSSNCGYFDVKKMLMSRMIFNCPTIDESFKMDIVLQYKTTEEEQFDPIRVIQEAVAKRTNRTERCVDLRNFKHDQKFDDVYVSLTSGAVMQIICFYLSKTLRLVPKTLILSHNELDKIDLSPFVKCFDSIETLDLQHNKLTYSALERMAKSHLHLEHLLLKGNPLCNDFETASEMICEIKKMYPTLKVLDSVDIHLINDSLNNFKVYIRNPKFSCLTDHFLHHYFSRFERDSKKLAVMYHDKASLSFVFNRQPFVSTASDDFFVSSNRNLLSMSDVTKTYDNLFLGKQRIDQALSAFPEVVFDPYSFRVDVPVTAKGELVVINCTGVFRLPKTEDVYSFSRACIIAPLRDGLGEWLILNDMWTVTNESPLLALKYFTKEKGPVKSEFAAMLNPQLKDKDVLVQFVSRLTHLKTAWVEKFLSESGWDLESTLLSFVDQYKANIVPTEAFLPFP